MPVLDIRSQEINWSYAEQSSKELQTSIYFMGDSIRKPDVVLCRDGSVLRPCSPTSRRSAKRLMWRAIAILLVIYIGWALVLHSLQNSLIFPGSVTQGQAAAVVQPAADAELLTLTTTGGERIAALFGAALTPEGKSRPDAAARPTILFFYGNAMCLQSAQDEFHSFRRLGANVLIPEFLGYGMSSGQASEAGCYATADAAYEYLLTRKDIDPQKIVAAGWSLGAAVAVDLASRKPVAGLVMLSAFSSVADMARLQFPYLPTALLKYRFDNEKKIAQVNCPIFIAHGAADRMIPSAMFERLAAAAKSRVVRFPVAGADHNDFFLVGGQQLLRAIADFVNTVQP